MGFFQDYSNSSSEEILEKILEGEIGYPLGWLCEKEGHLHPHGKYIIVDIYEHRGRWMKASDFEIDRELIPFDTKRVIVEDVETNIDSEMGTVILKRLARISRGVFQPTNISSRWLTPGGTKWSIQEVSFDFEGKRHAIEIALRYDYIEDMGLEQLNDIIEDTGYQYYQIEDGFIMVVVLTKEEAERLKKERGWKFPLTIL